tara:strand:- start:15526 stop:16908 length:1383 start_codon:yes stop_codon:yes gene_type:complete
LKINPDHYELSYYQSQAEANREVLVYELIYSNLDDKLIKLRKLDKIESNLEIKFHITQAIRAIKSKPLDGVTLKEIQDEKLRTALSSEKQVIRHKAYKYILKLKMIELIPALKQLRQNAEDVFLDCVILQLLAVDRIQNFNEIFTYVKTKDITLLAKTIEVFSGIKIQRTMSVIIQLLLHKNKLVHNKALEAFQALEPEQGLIFVTNMMANEKPIQRLAAANAIGFSTFDNASHLLARLLADEDDRVRAKAKEAVQTLNIALVQGAQSEEIKLIKSQSIVEQLQGTDASNTRKVASLLSSIGCVGSRDESLIIAIRPYLASPDSRVRANALETLGQVYKGTDKSQFVEFLKDSNNRVIGNAIYILCEKDHCPDEYFDQVNEALENLSLYHGINGCLTVVYCISNCLDERFLPYLSELYACGHDQVAISAYGLLLTWSETSEKAREELNLLNDSDLDDEID